MARRRRRRRNKAHKQPPADTSSSASTVTTPSEQTNSAYKTASGVCPSVASSGDHKESAPAATPSTTTSLPCPKCQSRRTTDDTESAVGGSLAQSPPFEEQWNLSLDEEGRVTDVVPDVIGLLRKKGDHYSDAVWKNLERWEGKMKADIGELALPSDVRSVTRDLTESTKKRLSDTPPQGGKWDKIPCGFFFGTPGNRSRTTP